MHLEHVRTWYALLILAGNHQVISKKKTTILKRFVGLKQSKNELTLSLEQYRALDNGILIDAVMAKKSSMGIDTIDDYMEIKKIMEYKS